MSNVGEMKQFYEKQESEISDFEITRGSCTSLLNKLIFTPHVC